jgi:sulfonate transport system substrate-binding protein
VTDPHIAARRCCSLSRRASLIAGLAALALGIGPAGTARAEDLAARLVAAVPPGVRLVVAEQNDQASIPWALSKAAEGVPYEAVFANFNGGPAVLEALISGGADIGYIGEAPLPIAIAAGVEDLVAVALSANPGTAGNYYVVAQPESGIRSIADLRGRTVAYPPGTGRHMALASILHKAGLSLETDVKGVELAGSEVAPTFSSRAVDAAVVLGQQYFRIGEPPILADGRGHNWGWNIIVVHKSLLDNPAKTAAVADFVRRAVKFYNWQRANPDAWIQASYVGQQGLTFEQGKRLFENDGLGAYYPIDDRAAEVFQEIADGLKATGALKRDISIAPYLDPRFNDIVVWQNQTDGVVPRDLVQPTH